MDSADTCSSAIFQDLPKIVSLSASPDGNLAAAVWRGAPLTVTVGAWLPREYRAETLYGRGKCRMPRLAVSTTTYAWPKAATIEMGPSMLPRSVGTKN